MKAPFSNRLPLCVAALSVGILGDTLASAQPAVETWVKHDHGMAESDDRLRQIVVDSAGNVIVAGSSDAGTEDAKGSDWIVVKDSNLGVPLWTNLYSGPYDSVDGANAVAEDSGGDAAVTRKSWNGTSYDYVIIKYSSTGVPLLTITRTVTNTIAVSWPSSSSNVTLQENTDGIIASNWSNVLATPQDDGTTRTVMVGPSVGSEFFRLIHP